jgi:hypothetical protein
LGVTILVKGREGAMRWCISVGAVLVAGAIVGGDVAGIAAPSPKSRFADTKHNVPFVNVELVIAVDVSYSMDMDELAIQREGYAPNASSPAITASRQA